jgi:hypothetical protein
MKIRHFNLIFSFLFMAIFAFGQTERNEFISVSISQSCPVVPFAKIETAIADYIVCQRNILPPRRKMNEEHLECYDSWDTKPKYANLDTADYDSIVNYVLTSGILELNLDYTLPDTTSGLIVMKSGACSIKFIIETANQIIELPISGANEFTLPKELSDFDILFKRITSKYIGRYE